MKRHFSKHWPFYLTIAIVGGFFGIREAVAAGTTANLSWVLPTADIEGKPVAVGDIKETLIQWFRPGASAETGNIRVAAPAKTVTIPNLTCGSFEFRAFTIMKPASAGAQSVKSDAAVVQYSTGIVCRVNAPSSFTAT